MKICSICSKKIASHKCRRCERWICAECYFHHGLCKECAKNLRKTE